MMIGLVKQRHSYPKTLKSKFYIETKLEYSSRILTKLMRHSITIMIGKEKKMDISMHLQEFGEMQSSFILILKMANKNKSNL